MNTNGILAKAARNMGRLVRSIAMGAALLLTPALVSTETNAASTVITTQPVSQDAYGNTAQSTINYNTNTLNGFGLSYLYFGIENSVGANAATNGYSGFALNLNYRTTPAYGSQIADFSNAANWAFYRITNNPAGETTITPGTVTLGSQFSYSSLGSLYEAESTAVAPDTYFWFAARWIGPEQIQLSSGDPTANNVTSDPNSPLYSSGQVNPLIQGNTGTQGTFTLVAAVPEPSSALLAFGALPLVVRRRRKH